MRIKELKIELNTRQMQLASLFISIQQVETRRQKEEETTKEYNRHKALANLTKTCYLKQMEKMSKQFKADTPLTNYPMAKSKNSTVLTNNISHKNDQILIPNIENNITDELNKLGISKSLTSTDNTNTNAEVEQLKVTQDNRLRRTLHQTTSAHNGVKQKKMMTTNQSTPDGTSENVKAKQKKITEENKATETIKQNKLTEDRASQNVKVKEKKITETTNQSTPDVTSQNVKVKEKKITEENKATVTTNQSTADVTSENVIVKEKKIMEENKATATTNQSTPDVTSQNVKVREKKITEENKATATTNQQKITEEERSTPHEEDKAMDIEDTPVMTHVYAKSPQNKRREENKASTAANQEMDDKLPTNGKLTYQEHKTAYPWAHAVSNNTFIRTDLAEEIEYINHKNIEKFLTTNMKKLLTKTIKLPSHINNTIEKKIKYLSDEAYRVRICYMIFKKKYNAIRHV